MKKGIGVRTDTLMLLALLFVVVGGYLVLTASTGSAQAGGGNAPGGTGTDGAAAGGVAAGAGGSTGGAGAVDGGAGASENAGSVQDVYVRALGGANLYKYDKDEIVVQRGVPVRLHFAADKDAGCGKSFVVYGLNIRLTSRNGEEAVAEFTP